MNTIGTILVSKKPLIITLVVLILGAAGTVTTIILMTNQKSIVPNAVAQKASFPIFYPGQNKSGLVVDRSSVQYDQQNHAVSYTLHISGVVVWLSEQATPDVFSQQGVYQYKLNQAAEYASFNSQAGTIYLTRPAELQGQTLAWANADGTLTLARASRDLTQNQWQILFNSMIKVN